MIKRVVLTLVIVLLSALVLIVLSADSPLMDEATELLLERVTKQDVGIGSARLTIFPGFKFTVKELTVKDPPGAGNLISIENLYLQGSILKLLHKDIYIKKLELIRCHLNLIESGGVKSLTDLFLAPKGEHEAEEGADKLFQWTVSLKEARVKDGSLTYVKGERTDARVHHTIENINTMVTLTKGDSTIDILDCTYKSASASLTGTIKYCFTRDPEFSLQARATAPLSLLQEMLSSPLTEQLCESKGELSLLVNGYLSHLSLDTTISISSSPTSVYLPLTILLKGTLDQMDQLELQKLEITSPCGSVHGEGMIAHLFSEKRWLELGWKSHLETSCFRHLFRDEVEIAGALPCSGKIVGNGENFTTSLAGDFSSFSLSSPYFISAPNTGIQTISALLVKREDTIEISSLKVDFDESYLELNSQISNAFTYPKTFEASAKGTLFLPEMSLLFPILKKELVVQGDTTLNIAIAGRYDRGESFEIQEGIFRALGSEIMTKGKISNAFSKECHLSFNTRIIPDVEEILNHFPGITSKNWQLIHLPPLSFTFDGPLNAVKIRGNCDLRGFDLRFPQIRIHTPPGGGSLQLEATVEERRKISLHDLSLNFGNSHLNLRGTISQKVPHVLPLEIEATGILRTDELITSFSKDLLGGFSTAGALSLKSIFRGDFSSFILTTDADLNETFWEIPTLIGKTRGLTNKTTFTLRKDEGLPIAVENCEWILESARGVFSLKNLNEGSGTWSLKIKTSAINLSSLQSLRWHRKNRFPTGEIEIDLETFFTPSDILKSSLGGFIELRNISFPFDGNDYFINTRLRAKGDHLEIPPLTIKYKSSDLTLQGNIFWGDKIQVESELTSDFIDLKDFIPISREQVSHQEKSLKNEQSQLLDAGCKILQYQPVLNIKADISNLTVGNQNIQNCILKLNGREGYYDMHHTFSTSGEASTIKTRIAHASQRSFKENCAFTIRGLNISELARQWYWEKVPLTGRINLRGELENFSGPEGGWIDPKSLNGQLSITFTEGEIRKLAFLRNILLLMNVPTVSVFTPVLREIFIFNQLLQLAKTKGRIVSLKTIPYERLEGDFSIKEGIATTEELMLISDVLTLAASGSIDIPSQTLKGKIVARPFGSLRSLLIKVPGLGKKVTNIQDKLLSTYFTIEGKVGEPEVKAVLLKSVKGGVRDIFSRLAERIKPKEK